MEFIVFFLFLAGIGFQSLSYTVSEGEEVELFVGVVSGRLTEPTTIQLSFTSGSASGILYIIVIIIINLNMLP